MRSSLYRFKVLSFAFFLGGFGGEYGVSFGCDMYGLKSSVRLYAKQMSAVLFKGSLLSVFLLTTYSSGRFIILMDMSCCMLGLVTTN